MIHKLDPKYFAIDPEFADITKSIPDPVIVLQKRTHPPSRLVLHQSMGSKNDTVTSDQYIVNQFSVVGYDRGYTIKDKSGKIIKRIKSLHLKPNSNEVSYSQAQYALHNHLGKWCLVPLVKYPMSDVCWHAGDTKWFPGTNNIHESSFGIEICGDYRFEELEKEAFIAIAFIFKPYVLWYREWLKEYIGTTTSYIPRGDFVVWGHQDFAETQCPGRIYEQIPYLRKLLEE